MRYLCVILFLVSIFILGCEKDGDEVFVSQSNSPATSVQGPTSGFLLRSTSGIPYSFEVTASNTYGLGTFSATLESGLGNVSVAGLSVSFTSLTQIGTTKFSATGSISAPFTGDGVVKVTVVYTEFSFDTAIIFNINVTNPINSLSFDTANPLVVLLGTTTPITITASASSPGGVFSITNVDNNGTGIIANIIDAAAGTFSVSNFLDLGEASVRVRYNLISSDNQVEQTTTFSIRVISSFSSGFLGATLLPSGGGGGGGAGTNDFDITVPEGVLINDLQVRVNIIHPFIDQLEVELISPSGTSIYLSDNEGGPLDENMLVIFNDFASQSMTANFNGGGGTFSPSEPLGNFLGEDPAFGT
ncbi:MAG: proprotein convertase P-domain-containing protein, partial [Planctomycetota bacterium]